MKKDLIEVQKELLQNFEQKTSADHLLDSLSGKIISAAQTAINKANTTTSYDEKISTLVEVIQEIVKILSQEKENLEVLKTKYEDQSDIINLLIDRTDSIPSEE